MNYELTFFLSAFKTCDFPVSRLPFLSDDKPEITCSIVACSMSFVFVCSRFALIFSFQQIDYDMSRCGLLLSVLFWFLQISFPFCFSSTFRIPNTCVLDFFYSSFSHWGSVHFWIFFHCAPQSSFYWYIFNLTNSFVIYN